MSGIETHTTHTVKLTWNQREPLDKCEFIRCLTSVLPHDAQIIGLAVADNPKEEPDYTTPAVIRALTITYITNTLLDSYRRS